MSFVTCANCRSPMERPPSKQDFTCPNCGEKYEQVEENGKLQVRVKSDAAPAEAPKKQRGKLPILKLLKIGGAALLGVALLVVLMGLLKNGLPFGREPEATPTALPSPSAAPSATPTHTRTPLPPRTSYFPPGSIGGNLEAIGCLFDGASIAQIDQWADCRGITLRLRRGPAGELLKAEASVLLNQPSEARERQGEFLAIARAILPNWLRSEAGGEDWMGESLARLAETEMGMMSVFTTRYGTVNITLTLGFDHRLSLSITSDSFYEDLPPLQQGGSQPKYPPDQQEVAQTEGSPPQQEPAYEQPGGVQPPHRGARLTTSQAAARMQAQGCTLGPYEKYFLFPILYGKCGKVDAIVGDTQSDTLLVAQFFVNDPDPSQIESLSLEMSLYAQGVFDAWGSSGGAAWLEASVRHVQEMALTEYSSYFEFDGYSASYIYSPVDSGISIEIEGETSPYTTALILSFSPLPADDD